MIGGLIGCPLFTTLCERLIFTWPVAVYAGYFAATNACVMALGNESRRASWIARGSLLGMIAGCLAYHALCRDSFIVMGWGFLVGILPALPVTVTALWAMKQLTRSAMVGPLLVSWVTSFGVFYWSAAVFIHVKT